MLLLIVALAGCLWAVGAPSAAAQQPGVLRVAHLSPDTPAVDVSVTPLGGSADAASFPGLHYGDVSAYERLPPGRYAVAVRAVGAGPGTAPRLSLAVDLTDGAARTVTLVSSFADLRLDAVDDDLSTPPAGTARVRVVDAATAGPADLSIVDGPTLAAGLSPAHVARPLTVPAGPRSLRLSAGGAATTLPLDLPAGAVVTLLVLDGPGGGVVVRRVTDAAGPAVVPVGSVDAGGGGTAPARSALSTLIADVLAGGVPVTPSPLPLAPDVDSTAPSVPAPSRLVVPAAGIDAPLAGIAPDSSGALAAPDEPGTAGWLQSGPAPGAVGPAVVAGHVDTVHGPAVFFSLRRLAPGDPVDVVRADGSTIRFVVDRVASSPKAAFPTAEVYGPTPDPELRLITCGGTFDRAARSYLDNLVVFAHLAG